MAVQLAMLSVACGHCCIAKQRVALLSAISVQGRGSRAMPHTSTLLRALVSLLSGLQELAGLRWAGSGGALQAAAGAAGDAAAAAAAADAAADAFTNAVAAVAAFVRSPVCG
jgi:hypothetical protein